MALAAGLLAAACGPAPPFAATPPPPGAMTWRTLRAEHTTVVTARLPDGRTERRRVRGLLAVARPDRLRLRALGPGDVTLFDLLDRDGTCVVVNGPGGASPPPESIMARVLTALCHDLRVAYRLGPAPAGARRVSYGDWRPVGASREPFRILIEDAAAGFTADITVTRLTLDDAVPPELFALP
ncbi:MAG: hypothetical protein HY906_14215 [Deltaproteobacteria bacterium]|nr:hypothetical protein [Deltaproteobacteria bacterium]